MIANRGTLIWDFDGTLAAREFTWSNAFIEALDLVHPGHQITPYEINSQISNGMPWHSPSHAELATVEMNQWWTPMEAFFGEAFNRLGFPDRKADLAKLVHKAAIRSDEYRLYPETLTVLNQCAEAGWNQVILSNHMPELPDIVADLGLKPFISQVFTSAALGSSKPDPRLFRKVLAALPMYPGLEGESPVWMIGDSYEADICGANGVNIPSILVRSPIVQHSNQAENLVEVLKFL